MPWKETSAVEEKKRFVELWLKREVSAAQLCRESGISEKTGYKYLARFRREGWVGLADRARAPHHQPNAVGEDVTRAILDARAEHPSWGPKKLLPLLHAFHPELQLPAHSTVTELLKRHGLIVLRRRQPRAQPYAQPFTAVVHPNDLWCCDFKGWFRVADGSRCDPFTLTDAASRLLLRCVIVRRADRRHVQPVIEAAFRQFGLPRAIRSDNGPPFATRSLTGLSHLAVWLLELGVLIERIRPGHPEDNGRHERMHLTLKHETASPPERTLRAQQRAFERFTRMFNEVRPHEALGQKTPASVYCPSPRSYPSKKPPLPHPDGAQIRMVRNDGSVKWKSACVFLSESLADKPVAFTQSDDHRWVVSFGSLNLCGYDERKEKFIKLDGGIRSWVKDSSNTHPAAADPPSNPPSSPM